MENIKTTLKTILRLGTDLKLTQNILDLGEENKAILNQIKFIDPFYAKNTFSVSVLAHIEQMIIIKACSFIDEYDKQFNENKHSDYKLRIRKIKQTLKPVKKRINQWQNLKDYRNHILAHNYIVHDSPIFQEREKKLEYIVPRTGTEYRLLVELITLMTQTISSEFKEIISIINFKESLLDKISIIGNEVDVNQELETIKIECSKIMTNLYNQ